MMVAGVLDPTKLVFVDECGTHTSLAPLYGYSPKGERLRLSVPRNRGKNTTLVASITLGGMGPSLWRSRARPPKKSSMLIWSMCSFPNWKKGR